MAQKPHEQDYDAMSALRAVELSENSSMISRAGACACAQGSVHPESAVARLKETGFRLLVFRWVPLLRAAQLLAELRLGRRTRANRGSGPRRNPFLFPI